VEAHDYKKVISEPTNLAQQSPQIVENLKKQLPEHAADLEKNSRPCGSATGASN